METLDDEIRVFKHDFANIMSVISGYINANDMNGLRKYFSSLEGDFNRIKTEQYLDSNIITEPGIYNLILAKYAKANSLNIKTNFEIFFDFNNVHMPIYDLSKILGILLDNAIEAAKDCEKKQINIIFRESKKKSTQFIIIENTYSNKKIDTNKIFEKGVSEKQNHYGIGLWEVSKIVKKNNNIILNTSNDNDIFRQELQIYY